MTQDTRIAIGGDVTSVTPLPPFRTHVTAVTHSPNRRHVTNVTFHVERSLDTDSIPCARLRVSGQPHRWDKGDNT